MAFKRVPRWKYNWVNSIISGTSPPLYCTLTIIAMQGHQKIVSINGTNITLAASVVQVQCTEFLCDVHNTNSTTVLHSQYLYYTRSEGSNNTVVKTSSVLEKVGMVSDSICTESDTAPTLYSCGSGQRAWDTCCSELCTAEAVHSTSTSRNL